MDEIPASRGGADSLQSQWCEHRTDNVQYGVHVRVVRKQSALENSEGGTGVSDQSATP